MRSVLPLLVAAVLLPATAQAETFYVDDDAAAPSTPCTDPDPQHACKKVQDAIIQSRQVPGPDTIKVAAGVYGDQIIANAVEDNGNTIEGAGTSSDPAVGTIIASPAPPGNTFYINATNFTLRGMRVRITAAGNHTGIYVSGSGTVADMVVDMQNPATTASGIGVNGGPWVLDHVRVSGAFNGYGLATYQPPSSDVTLRDSDISVNANPALIGSPGSHVVVERSTLRSSTAYGGPTVASPGASFVLDSSLVAGGHGAVEIQEPGAAATIRNSTLDSGAPGPGSLDALRLLAAGSKGEVVGSILVGTSLVAQGASMACRSTDAPVQQQAADVLNGAIDCGPVAGNTSSAVADLFTDAAAGDYTLRPGSSAIDSGQEGEIGPGESALDLLGQPRLADGDGDCTARRDKGAYEFARPACPPPPAADPGTPPAGEAPPASMPVVTTPVAPVLSALSVRKRRLRYVLSSPARVTFAIERRKAGRRARFARARRLTRQGVAGRNVLSLSRRKLKRGRYRVTVNAVDAAGHASNTLTLRFRLRR